MAPIEVRAAAQLSSTALAAILGSVGAVILALLIALIVGLVRAVRTHRRLLADLEERGVSIAQSRKDAKCESIMEPRRVLKRNTILPFNSRSGWGALQSVDSINPPEPPSVPPHYAPPKPSGFVGKPSRLSWPFSARRASGRAIHMRKIRVPVLSTVIESPKPSPLVPVLSGPLGGELSSPRKSLSRPSSDQSLLQHHPAFRNKEREGGSQGANIQLAPGQESLRRSLTAKPVNRLEKRVRPNRSKSVAEIPVSSKSGAMSRLPRPRLHVRSASMCSQSSGTAPVGDLPPLPLEVARIKSEARRRSLLSRSPSRLSISSFESAGSSILATQSSPILSRSSNARVQKVTKRDWRNSMIVGPRPLRDTLALHGKNQRSQSSMKSSVARFSSVAPSTRADSQALNRSSMLTNSSSMQSIGRAKTAESVTLSKVSSPACSPLTVRSLATPKRKSGSHVTPYGSPEDRRKRSSILYSASGNSGAPKRQLSQASNQASSTRSSNGNPFQWDPAPLSSGKPLSALKGSPSARKGHRRQNCVRISLVPTMLGPPSRSSSPSPMNEIPEDSPTAKKLNVGLGFSNTRSLPRPPSASIFAPDVKITATSIRASLTPSSPTLSMANYDHGAIGSPIVPRTTYVLPALTERERNRLSTGSIFTIPSFPSPCHEPVAFDNLVSPPTFALSRPSNEYSYDGRMLDTSVGASSPFEVLLDFRSSPDRPLLAEQYDPEHPQLIYETPSNSPVRNFSSPFSTILEESSAQTKRTTGSDYERLRSEDSPPCSPKTILPPTFPVHQEREAYNLPIKDTTIPEEPELWDTIDPVIIGKDAFSTMDSGFNNNRSSIMQTHHNSRGSIPIPTSPGFARSMFEHLLEAALPSSPLVARDSDASPSTRFEPPSLSIQSSPSSIYSSPSSSPPIPPRSPRLQHAQLATPALNLTNMPTLSPSPQGPRGSPARSLRSSILKLRRENSDAKKGGRGERRYLRLGREDSIALPGEESWLEELDNGEDEGEEGWDEEKSRRLVNDLLEDWEEEATILELVDSQEATSPKEEKEKEKQEGKESLAPTSSPRPSTPVATDRSSSIWEDGEKFWASTPPFPPNSPNKPKQRFQPLSSSPLPLSKPTPLTPPFTNAIKTSTPSRKRDFEVAKDDSPTQQEDANSNNGNTEKKERRQSLAGNRYRKRSALGISTPNVRITVRPPSGGFSTGVGNGDGNGTPGSLYDADGFLRV